LPSMRASLAADAPGVPSPDGGIAPLMVEIAFASGVVTAVFSAAAYDFSPCTAGREFRGPFACWSGGPDRGGTAAHMVAALAGSRSSEDDERRQGVDFAAEMARMSLGTDDLRSAAAESLSASGAGARPAKCAIGLEAVTGDERCAAPHCRTETRVSGRSSFRPSRRWERKRACGGR
jgi:hypothetical protein